MLFSVCLYWGMFYWTGPVIPFLEVLDCFLALLFDLAIPFFSLSPFGVPHHSSPYRGLPSSRKPRHFVIVTAEVHVF